MSHVTYRLPNTACHTLPYIYNLPHPICPTSSDPWHWQLNNYLNDVPRYVYDSIMLHESVIEHVESRRLGVCHRVQLGVYLKKYSVVYVRLNCRVNLNEIQRCTWKCTRKCTWWSTRVYRKSFVWMVHSSRLSVSERSG